MEFKKQMFSPIEKKVFLNILKKYERVVESKQLDGTTLRTKNMAWDRITAEYNANPFATFQVTSKKLRKLWMNMKQRNREKIAKVRQNRLAVEEGTEVIEADIYPDVSPYLLVSVEDEIDSDNVYESVIEAKPFDETEVIETSRPIVKEEVISVKTEPIDPVTAGTTSNTTPPLVLKTDKNSELQKEYCDRVQKAEIHELQKELLQERIREAKAKADLAELLLRNYSDTLLSRNNEH